MKKVIDVTRCYASELTEINNILTKLENGRVYGYNGNRSQQDGSLETNAEKLRGKLNELISKIEYGKKSDMEAMRKVVSNNDFYK
ncbi:hypothetical protein V1502_16965 [Bacillus sp. SCS-153A]|uniref:hypothetical protein n=1 Tax=Rossellomorea sedimentorum TaxID=3115294 RepID=UPI0039063396